MKIITKVGNLLDVQAGHIVHGCNAQGVMGSGVALAVKNKYPGAYKSYRRQYDEHGLVLGNVYSFEATPTLVIWNAITQEGFGQPTRNCSYDAIENCFRLIDQSITGGWHDNVVDELHIPLIGAGLGGGNWEIIREIIEQTVTVPTTLWVLN